MIPGLGRSPGEGNSHPFQYSCLENPMNRGAWQATVHGVTKRDTTERLSLTSLTCHEVMGLDAMIFVLCVLSFKPDFSLFSFTFIKKLFSSSLLSAIRVVPSTYLRLLIFILASLIPVCASPSFMELCNAAVTETRGELRGCDGGLKNAGIRQQPACSAGWKRKTQEEQSLSSLGKRKIMGN